MDEKICESQGWWGESLFLFTSQKKERLTTRSFGVGYSIPTFTKHGLGISLEYPRISEILRTRRIHRHDVNHPAPQITRARPSNMFVFEGFILAPLDCGLQLGNDSGILGAVHLLTTNGKCDVGGFFGPEECHLCAAYDCTADCCFLVAM